MIMLEISFKFKFFNLLRIEGFLHLEALPSTTSLHSKHYSNVISFEIEDWSSRPDTTLQAQLQAAKDAAELPGDVRD